MTFPQFIGIALVSATITIPIAIVTIKEHQTTNELKLACIKVGGEWSGWGTGKCIVPQKICPK